MQKALLVVLAFAALGVLYGIVGGHSVILNWSLVALFGVAGLDGILTALNEKASLPLRVFGGVGFLVCAAIAFVSLDYARLISSL